MLLNAEVFVGYYNAYISVLVGHILAENLCIQEN